MSPLDHATWTDRLSTLQTLAYRQKVWADLRRDMNTQQRRAPGRLARAIGALRLRARRGMKGRRSLA